MTTSERGSGERLRLRHYGIRYSLRPAAAAVAARRPVRVPGRHGRRHNPVLARHKRDTRRHADSAFSWSTPPLTCGVGLSTHRAAERGGDGGRYDRMEPAADPSTAAAGPGRFDTRCRSGRAVGGGAGGAGPGAALRRRRARTRGHARRPGATAPAADGAPRGGRDWTVGNRGELRPSRPWWRGARL